jgi:hypothetical protein
MAFSRAFGGWRKKFSPPGDVSIFFFCFFVVTVCLICVSAEHGEASMLVAHITTRTIKSNEG